MLKTIETKLGRYEIYNHYLIVVYNEGVDVSREDSSEIINILTNNMKQPFGWISNKVNSYSADPFVMLDIIPNVPFLKCYCGIGYGIPARDWKAYAASTAPNDFPLESFDHLDDAIAWTTDILMSAPNT